MATKNYRETHKTQIQQYNKRHYQTHKTERQRYYQAHKAEHQQYDKDHRAQILKRRKEYRKTIKGHLWMVWAAMLGRCNNPKHKQYKDYGGRGIQVKFAYFKDFFDNIVKELKVDPRGLTIDRINNDSHYEQGNIRFVTQAENNRNR